VHKIAISQAALDRMTARIGKLHPFDTIDPRKAALLVIDMQNYFVKPGHQGEIPLAREIVPNINRLAASFRQHGGHVVWIRNGTRDSPPTRCCNRLSAVTGRVPPLNHSDEALASGLNAPRRIIGRRQPVFISSGVAMYFSIRGVAPFLRMSSSQRRWMRGS
jgi:hypothetical protein